MSQVKCLASGRALLTGAGEEGHPGLIQIWNIAKPKKEDDPPKRAKELITCIDTIQAHSSPITRMSLNYYNDWLFTACEEGFIYAFEVKERDSRNMPIVHTPYYSDEILTEKQEIDETI